MAKSLTPKQEAFCRELLIDNNQTQAAIRAGYSPKTASEQASRLLSKVNIQERVKKLRAAQEKRTEITADKVLKRMWEIANLDPADIFNEDGTPKPIHEIPKAARRAIAGIEIEEIFAGRGDEREVVGHTKKFKLWSKDAQLTNLAKHFKLLTDVVEVKDSIADRLKRAEERLKKR